MTDRIKIVGNPKHLGGFRLLGGTPPGTCPDCAIIHDPAMPHNQQSLFYQYKFRGEHGRWPTWKDAMKHCTPSMRESWTEALADRGIKVSDPSGHPASKRARGRLRQR